MVQPKARGLLIVLALALTLAGCGPKQQSSSSQAGTTTSASTSTAPTGGDAATQPTEDTQSTTTTTTTEETVPTSPASKEPAATEPSEDAYPPSEYSIRGNLMGFATTSAENAFKRLDGGSLKVYAVGKADSLPGTLIAVNPGQTYQVIDGFGAAMTDSSAHVMYKLSEDKRNSLMERLFDESKGIGLSYLRNTMGGCDFSTDYYTYDDLPEGQTDPELKRFSIERDMKQIIPLEKQALKINPKIKIIASPWTAPPWMKTIYTYNGLMDPSGEYPADAPRLKKEFYGTWANYFVKYIQAYKEQGIVIDAVTHQNEPGVDPPYPAMRWNEEEMIDFIKNHLYPAFQKNKLDTKIYAWDYSYAGINVVLQMMFEAGEALDGAAFHFYDGDSAAQNTFKDAFPDKNVLVTEASGLTKPFMNGLFWHMNNITSSLRNQGTGYILWNLALDQNGGPTVNEYDPTAGGSKSPVCVPLVTVNTANNSYSFTSDYYALAHFSKFIRPGAKRVFSSDTAAASDGKLLNLACMNEDGTVTVVLTNQSAAPADVKIQVGDRVLTTTLSGRSVTTLTWSAK